MFVCLGFAQINGCNGLDEMEMENRCGRVRP